VQILQRYQQALKCSAFIVQQPGFRPKEIILVTTLVDSKRYSSQVSPTLSTCGATEVNFKHLKTTLKMEMILRKLLKWCTRKSGCICVQLAAKLDVAISPAS